MEQAPLSIRAGKRALAGTCPVSQDEDPCVHRSLAHARVCAHTPIPKQGGNWQPGCYPVWSSRDRGHSRPHHLTSPLGNSLGWAEPLYLFTGYLEHLLNPNCTAEAYSPLNCDQPDSRQNSKDKDRPALSSVCQVILPHVSGQVWQSKDHPDHKESIVSSFQGYSAPAASITFGYSYRC